MKTVDIEDFEQISSMLRNPNMAQALYDEGAVITEKVLLVLHGEEHRKRRMLEFGVFRRDFFRYYEQEVFPRTLQETMDAYIKAGRVDLVEFGYRVTINLSADFAGIDRPRRDVAETEQLLRLVMTFSEGATMVHSTRDKEELRAEVRAALAEYDEAFLQPSIARRKALLAKFAAGEIPEDDLPRDVLTVLLRNEDGIDIPDDVLRREIAFYLQAGSHSTANSTTHAFHEITQWCEKNPADRERIARDPLFLQRCVHESLRLHPASPEAWRRPICPVRLGTGEEVNPGDRVVLDLHTANRNPDIFGADADEFNPHRVIPTGYLPFGLTFGIGVHTCLGRDLDGGVVPRGEVDPATHQYGIVPMLVRVLLENGATPDPDDPAEAATYTVRPNWGRYPILFTKGNLHS